MSWAKEAIDELDSMLESFFANPDVKTIVKEFDADSGEYLLKAKFVMDLPRGARKATEALVNTRHSFDQIANAGGRFFGKANFKANFPWASDPRDLQRLLEARKFPQELWPAIKAQEPYCRSDTYPGGNNLIRALATVANQKHTVGLTVAMQAVGVGYDFVTIRGKGPIGIPVPRWDPVNKEIVLVRSADESLDMKGNGSIEFHVLFKEAKIPHPVDVIGALKLFAGRAETLLNDFKAVCSN